jgi:hypothetical protein
MSKNFVLHFCKNPDCNVGWLDIDLTNVITIPPKWKYCRKCCELLGIDFNKQEKPKSNRGKNLRKDKD